MRIAIDVSPLSHPRTGIGNYLRGMVRGVIDASAGEHETIPFAPTSLWGSRWLSEATAGFGVEVRRAVVPFAHAGRTAWSRVGWPPVERFLGAIDVLHFSDWMYPPQRSGVRATTIHDLVPLRFPDWVPKRTYAMHRAKYANAARTCDVVFVNSSYTKADAVGVLGFAEERVHVAYPGVDPVFRPEGPRADLRAPYLLSTATPEPRKNLGTLLQAFARLRSGRPELELVLVGPNDWNGGAPLVRNGVRRLGYVDDARLAELFRGASAFVYPSRFEGFGMPVIEAMASGAPVVASSHASLDEASGEAALRAHPADPDAFADAIEQALAEPEPLCERGLGHAGRFSWEGSGRAILDGYASAL